MRSLVFLALLAAGPAVSAQDKSAIGSPVKDFKLRDLVQTEEKNYSLSEFQGKKMVVLVWISEKCDITWRYEKRTGALVSEFAKKDVQFFAVAGSGNDTVEGVKKYAESKNYGMPVLDDVKSQMSNYFGVRTTPTYVVIDKEGKLRYRGACDDLQCGGGFKADESTAKERYVAEALKALLEGKDPAVTEKRGVG